MDSLTQKTKSSASWEEPEQFQHEPTEHIHLDDLPEVFRAMCEAISKSLCVDSDMVAATMLGVLSVCVNKHSIIIDEGRNWIEPLSLYMMGIAPPGEKKSPVIKLLLAPVNEWVQSRNKELKPLVAESKQRLKNLQKQLRKAENDLEKGKGSEEETLRLAREIDAFQPIKKIRLFSGDVTTEKLADLLLENDEVFSIVSTEGGILETIAGRYQNGVANSDIYLQAFNSEPVSVDRKNSGTIILDEPALSIILFCQPVVWNRLMEREDLRNNGFVDRFLPFAPKPCIGKDRFGAPKLPPDVVEKYAKMIRRLLDMDCSFNMRLSDEAESYYAAFYDGFTSGIELIYDDLRGWASKHKGVVARIAGILQLVKDGSATVSGETMIEAISIADYFQEQARRILRNEGISQADRHAIYILKRIKNLRRMTYTNENSQIVLSYRDLRQSIHRNGLKKKEDYYEPLQVLYDKGYINFNSDDFDKMTEILINPSIWGDDKE